MSSHELLDVGQLELLDVEQLGIATRERLLDASGAGDDRGEQFGPGRRRE